MAQVRKIAGISILSIVGAVLALWVGAGVWAMWMGPAWFSAQLKSRAGIDAAIGSLRTDFLTSLTFRDILVSAPARGRIDEIRFSFRPWDLFSLRARDRHVFQVRIRRPDLEFLPRSSTVSPKGGPLKILPFRADVTDGRIRATVAGRTWEIDGLSASVGASPFRLNADADGRVSGYGPLRATLKAGFVLPRNWELRVSADAIDLSSILALVPASARRFGHGSGMVGATVALKGTWAPAARLDDWRVEARSEGVVWQRVEGARPVHLAGSVSLTPRLFEISQLNVGGAVDLSGQVRSPLKNPILDLSVNVRHEKVSTLASYWRAAPISAEGTVSGSATVTGPAAAPSAQGRIDFDGSVGPLRLPRAAGDFSFADGHFDSTTTFAGGRMVVSGAAFGGGNPVWSVQAKDLSLGAFAEENGWKNVSGTVGARFLIRGSPAVVNGRIESSPIEWGRLRFARTAGASVRLTKDELIVRADNGALAATAYRDGSKLRLDALKVALSGAGNVAASGTIDLNTREIDLDADLEGLSPDIWPPLVARYPHMSGRLAARGKVSGTLSQPLAAFNLTWADLRFRPESDGYEGSGLLSLDADAFSLNDARLAGGYRGRASFRRDGADWTAELFLDEASPRLLRDIARSTAAVSGAMTGRIEARSAGGGTIVSSVTWVAGSVGDFAFDSLSLNVDGGRDRIAIRDAALVKGAQAIRGGAEFIRQGRAWRVDALAQIQRWGIAPLQLDGELRARGSFDPAAGTLDLKTDVPVLWVADRALENFAGRVTRSAEAWKITANAGDAVSVEASLGHESGRLNGRVRAKDLQLADLFSNEAPDEGRDAPPEGVYAVDALIGGTLGAPNARVRLSVADGRWRLEPFSADAILDVGRSSVTLVSSQVDLGSGGRVFARGNIGIGKGAPMRIEGAGSDIDLQAVFHLLWWPVRWKGQTEAGFVLTRGPEGIETEIRFDGDHEGFGPFREGGAVRGEIRGRGREWELGGVYAESGDGYARLKEGSKIFLDRSGTGTTRLVAEVRNVRLGPLTLFGGVEAAGSWKGEPGPDKRRRVDLDVFARSLWINQFVLDGNVTRIAIEDKSVAFSPIPGSGQQVSGRLSYADFPDLLVNDLRFLENGREKIFLSGNVGAQTWDFRLRGRAIDAAVARGLLDTQIAMSGPVDVDVIGQGSPSRPRITADVRWTDGRIGPLPLDSAEGKVFFDDGDLRLDQVIVEKKNGYVLNLDAHLGFGDARDRVDPEINVLVERGDARILEDMYADVRKARGSFDARLRLGGSAGLATISGYVNAQKLSIRSAYTPDLDRGEARLRFDKNRLHVDRAVARLGRGDVVGGGHVDFKNGVPDHYDLFLKSEGEHGASIRVPQLAIAPGPVLGRFSLLKKKLSGVSRGEPLIDLEFSGPAESPTLAGTVLMENTVFTYPPTGRGEGANTWWKRFLARMNWEITLKAGRRTWYQNELVDASITGEMDLRGQTGDMNVQGKIYSDQGSIVYSGNEFRIKEAELEVETRRPFITTADRKQIVVYLKATAEKEVFYTDGLANSNQDVIVMVVDRAPIGEIQPRFYAKNNPGLSSQRALQLALGLPFGDAIDNNSLLPDQRARVSDQADTEKMLRLGLVQLLDSSLASPLARAIARSTGLVDFIRVTYQENDPNVQDGSVELEDRSGATDVTDNEFLRYAKGTKVRFGRGLGRRLFADYSFRVDEFESQINLRHELELAYRVHRNLFLRGTSELDRERELGRPPDRRAILENQWRFGLPRRKPAAAPPPEGSDAGGRPDAG